MIETIQAYIETHKTFCGGLGAMAIGLFLVTGSILRWGWLTELGGNEYRNMGLISAALYEKFGAGFLRARNILIGIVLIIAGLFFAWTACKK